MATKVGYGQDNMDSFHESINRTASEPELFHSRKNEGNPPYNYLPNDNTSIPVSQQGFKVGAGDDDGYGCDDSNENQQPACSITQTYVQKTRTENYPKPVKEVSSSSSSSSSECDPVEMPQPEKVIYVYNSQCPYVMSGNQCCQTPTRHGCHHKKMDKKKKPTKVAHRKDKQRLSDDTCCRPSDYDSRYHSRDYDDNTYDRNTSDYASTAGLLDRPKYPSQGRSDNIYDRSQPMRSSNDLYSSQGRCDNIYDRSQPMRSSNDLYSSTSNPNWGPTGTSANPNWGTTGGTGATGTTAASRDRLYNSQRYRPKRSWLTRLREKFN